jgi:hypothetical protein
MRRTFITHPMLYGILGVSLGIILGTMVRYGIAWTQPLEQAPSGNVAGPLTVNEVAQIKKGPLGINMGAVTDFINDVEFQVNGNAFIAGKAYTAPTEYDDIPTTVVTKGYLDSKLALMGGGSGTLILDIESEAVHTAPGGVLTQFTNEIVDVLNVFTPPNTEVSLPSGTYLIEIEAHGCGFLSNNGTGQDQVNVKLRKNGTKVLTSPTLVSNSGLNCLTPRVTGTVTVATGEKITMEVWHDEISTPINSHMKVTSFSGGGGGTLECISVSAPWDTSLSYGDRVQVDGPAGFYGVSCDGHYYDTNSGVLYHGYTGGSFSADRRTCYWNVADTAITEGSVKGDFCRIVQ